MTNLYRHGDTENTEGREDERNILLLVFVFFVSSWFDNIPSLYLCAFVANLRYPWRTSSQTMCGSCGPISFSQASRTAADEPGMEMTIRPRYVPAVARDMIAAGPISR